ncbi:hypothetical protein CW751_07430 [Brumimicrobium salinarum]|uniref:TonB C-terminal domain-containing protein n=1 Tax=Brumimicrobium salinarum TaxID=2058658 RepID=A0A2I0R351_9FLAO|nr:hypothetical protein [Brumimicrobium salinarum]PKR80989.1 hypothetical protein CW751_07430 [Brumimicrobium salinarum]
MDKIIEFIERHKFGLLITLVVHIGLFVYFQIATYKEVVLFEPWDFQTMHNEAPDDIQITPDQIETSQEKALLDPETEVSSFVKNENDQRERSSERDVNYTSYSESGNPEAIENEFEQKLKDEIRQRRKEKSNNEPSSTADLDNSPKEKPNEKQKSGEKASSKAIKGATMVSYSLKDRHPLNHNDWYVRNPGYTCGNVNGVVKIAITVNEGGDVVAAKVVNEESKNATPCMLQKAKEYALMSRFNYSENAPKSQSGVITYRFVYR